MGFPDRIERTVEVAHPPAKVWAALTTAEGLGAWFGNEATIDLRPGGSARMTWTNGFAVDMRVERVEEPTVFGFTWQIYGLPEDDPRRTYVEFTLEPVGSGTRLTVVESGFAQLPSDAYAAAYDGNTKGWASELASWSATSMRPDVEAIAEQVFTALADPTRRAILAALAADGPATATDLAGRLPISRQAIAKHLALLAEAGLVTAEPGERRRVRYRLRSAPMQAAQQFLAALARDWDRSLEALTTHLDRSARAGRDPVGGGLSNHARSPNHRCPGGRNRSEHGGWHDGCRGGRDARDRGRGVGRRDPADGRDGHGPRHRTRFLRVVRGAVGVDDGGDDAARRGSGGGQACSCQRSAARRAAVRRVVPRRLGPRRPRGRTWSTGRTGRSRPARWWSRPASTSSRRSSSTSDGAAGAASAPVSSSGSAASGPASA